MRSSSHADDMGIRNCLQLYRKAETWITLVLQQGRIRHPGKLLNDGLYCSIRRDSCLQEANPFMRDNYIFLVGLRKAVFHLFNFITGKHNILIQLHTTEVTFLIPVVNCLKYNEPPDAVCR